MQTRELGKTGERLSIVGMGGIALMGHDQFEANRIVSEGLDAGGVNYFKLRRLRSWGGGGTVGWGTEDASGARFLACKTGRWEETASRKNFGVRLPDYARITSTCTRFTV